MEPCAECTSLGNDAEGFKKWKTIQAWVFISFPFPILSDNATAAAE